VASTKAFTTQLCVLLLLALRIGEAKGALDPSLRAELVQGLRELPALLERINSLEPRIAKWAQEWREAKDFLYLARGPLYPIALEGALKLKEISYIHAEGYPAGEMKHGPIALIDERMPVVVLTPFGRTYEKMLSNVEEVRARHGRVIAIASDGDRALDGRVQFCLHLPYVSEYVAPILETVPLQLLAYHTAVRKGCDVDQPRNLAKSVTVE
jgi:glucosamine--fructose-6-phosphate aminotransferase (isomerizing)